jgi:bacterial microcompartment shell protein
LSDGAADRLDGPGPALAVVELASIARGHRVADAMLKRAPVRLMRADPISPGKFVVLVEGDVASVDESFRVGTDVAGDRVVDTLLLAQSHPGLWPALAGEANARDGVESLGIVETTTVAATVRAADAALKAAKVLITEMQLGRGIGGKAFFTVTGLLAEVEAAVEAAVGVLDPARVHTTEIIPAPHADLAAKLR